MKRLLDIFLTTAILLFLGLIVAKLQNGYAEPISGAARVIDGDTLSIGDTRIRLSGLDAPEIAQTCLRDDVSWECGRDAKERLRAMIGEREVVCMPRGGDRYGRMLATCVAGERALNAGMVEDGYAIADGAYEAEERRARAAGRAIWAGTFDPPRQWRRTHGLAEMDETNWFEAVTARLRAWF